MSSALAGVDVFNRVPEETGGETLLFWCPGCECAHGPRHGPGAGPRWTWNGDPVKPVLSPSIVVRYSHLSDAARERNAAFLAEHGRYMTPEELPPDVHQVCHSFVGCNGAEPGQIIFLGDSTHELAGKTVPLTPWTDA